MTEKLLTGTLSLNTNKTKQILMVPQLLLENHFYNLKLTCFCVNSYFAMKLLLPLFESFNISRML